MAEAASQGMSSQGTYITTGNGATPELFTEELAEVKNIGGPDEKADELETTHLRSPGGYREFIQSFKDGGELPLTLNFVPTDATQDSIAGIRKDFQTGVKKNRKITYPDGTTCTFNSWVKGIGATAQVGNVLELNVTLRINGATTWVEATTP